MSTTETLISNYGLLGVFLGGLFEGETVLVLAAIAAQHGLLSLYWVFVVGAAGAFLGDQAWFFLARHRSESAIVQRLASEPRFRRVLDFVDSHPTLFVLSFRFIYGLRTAGALACGLSRINWANFVILNLLAAMLWTAIILALGYVFGQALEIILGELGRIEWKLLLASPVLILLFFGMRHFHRRLVG
jgi:membrane protein DedA with SNARE-associated domain